MTVVVSSAGVDFTLADAPPLLDAPLSLLDYSRMLVDNAGEVAAASEANERAYSAQAAVSALMERMTGAPASEVAVLSLELEAAQTVADELDSLASAAQKRAADIERWTASFQYLPELPIGDTQGWAPAGGVAKQAGNDQQAFAWYDPFLAVALDERSLFGWPATDYRSRMERAMRGLTAHEPWQVEREFWAGAQVPTNYHLSASTETVTNYGSGTRIIDGWADPTAAPGTVLGTSVGLGQALAALDQAIANADAGTGIIHATPYVVQRWMAVYPFIRDTDGKIYTVNHNLILAGYGYPGTGPDRAARAVTDGVSNSTTSITSASAAFSSRDLGVPITGTDISPGTVIAAVASATAATLSQAATGSHTGDHWSIGGPGGNASSLPKQWAYATEMTYQLRGDARTYPWDLRQMSPAAPVANEAPVRAERPWAIISNRLLRAAVLVDTTTT